MIKLKSLKRWDGMDTFFTAVFKKEGKLINVTYFRAGKRLVIHEWWMIEKEERESFEKKLMKMFESIEDIES